ERAEMPFELQQQPNLGSTKHTDPPGIFDDRKVLELLRSFACPRDLRCRKFTSSANPGSRCSAAIERSVEMRFHRTDSMAEIGVETTHRLGQNHGHLPTLFGHQCRGVFVHQLGDVRQLAQQPSEGSRIIGVLLGFGCGGEHGNTIPNICSTVNRFSRYSRLFLWSPGRLAGGLDSSAFTSTARSSRTASSTRRFKPGRESLPG